MKQVLGMILTDLSLRDICEEIADLRRDLLCIEEYEVGNLSLGEMMRETSFMPAQKQSIIEAIAQLREEKKRRQAV